MKAFIIGHRILIGGIVGILIGAAFGFAFFGKAKDKTEILTAHAGAFLQQVSVSGKVTAVQSVDLGFAQSGRVSHTYAAVGDTVSEGAILAEIENGDLRATVVQKQAALDLQKAKLASLQSGKKEETALAQANQALLNAIEDAYTKSEDAVYNKFDQFISNPHGSNPQLTFLVTDGSLKNKVEFSRLAIDPVLPLWQTEVASLAAGSDLTDATAHAESNLTQVSALLTDAASALNRAVPSGGVSQSAINGYAADIAAARTSINAVSSALTTAITSQKDASINFSGSPEDLAAQEAEVRAAEADLDNARAQLRKTEVLAPFSGVVTKMDAKVGAIVSSNTSEIAMQSRGAFQIESFVPEINIPLLKVGDPARVTLDAYGDNVPFSAKIVSIDPAETLRDGVSTYRAILQFDTTDPRIRTGMTANLTVTTLQKENVIAVPQGILINRDGKTYLEVEENGAVVEREVTTGAVSSIGNIEIISGLKEGDLVVIATST